MKRACDTVTGLARHAPVLCVATAAMFVVMTLLEFLYFRDLSGGLPSLDIRITGFSPDEGMAWLTALGRRGSEIILVWHYLTFDLLFPALLSLTMVSLILASGAGVPWFRVLRHPTQAVIAVLLVLPYTLLDYGQNIAVGRLLSDFLAANPDSLALASTLIEWKFITGAIPPIVVLCFYLLGRKKRV